MSVKAVFKNTRLSFLLLAAACFIYGLAGAPTPARIYYPEFAIAFCLGLLVLTGHGFGNVTFFSVSEKIERWKGFGLLLLVYGLTIPLIQGNLYSHGETAILRDLIGFAFLLLPMLFVKHFRKIEGSENIIVAILTVTGIFFALRFIYSVYKADPTLAFASSLVDEHPVHIMLANAPTVLFSGIILISMALKSFGAGLVSLLKTVLCAGLAGIAVLSAILALQRASLVGIALSFLVTLCIVSIKKPGKGSFLIAGSIALAIILFPQILILAQQIVQKTVDVGFNSRIAELLAVTENLGGYWGGHFFGRGWGASFLSPAAGYQEVTYTHNLFSAMWLKMGIPGVILTLGYCVSLSGYLFKSRLIFEHPAIWCALFFPLIINVLFYANHKSLDFGLILLLISIYKQRYDPRINYTPDIKKHDRDMSN